MRIRVGLPALLWMSLVLAVTAASAGAQRSAVTLAYQLTHIDMGEPFPSPGGKKLVFEITLGGFQQLFIMNPDGSGKPKSLTMLPTTTRPPGHRMVTRSLTFPTRPDMQ